MTDPSNYMYSSSGSSSCCVTDVILSKQRLTPREKREFCAKGPDHTPLSISEECVVGSRRIRKSFLDGWFKKFPWLTVSSSKQTVLCFPCLLFSSESSVWTTVGSTSLKKFRDRAVKHENSHRHIESAFSMKIFMKNRPIDELLNSQSAAEKSRHNKQVSLNRSYLKRLIDVITFLGVHEIAYRAHDEGKDQNYRGNYIDLVMYTANIDQSMKSFLESNKLFKGTSMSIQNDLLTSIESTVMDHLKHEIQLVDFVSIQVDEASDICSKEYVSIVMRYALQDGPVERFLGFFNIRQRNAEGIFQIIKEALDSYECDYRKIVSITCDGASVMSGSVNGVAMKMKELNSSIFLYIVMLISLIS